MWNASEASEARDHDFIVCWIFGIVKKYELIILFITYHNCNKLQNLFNFSQIPYFMWGTSLKILGWKCWKYISSIHESASFCFMHIVIKLHRWWIHLMSYFVDKTSKHEFDFCDSKSSIPITQGGMYIPQCNNRHDSQQVVCPQCCRQWGIWS